MTEPSLHALALARKIECEQDHLYFTRYFFYLREGIKFRVNWHHHYLADIIHDVIEGRLKNVIINVPPGSSKTEMVSINFMARGLVKNKRSRFLHVSYADDLVALNSMTTKDIVQSDEFQSMWPMAPKDDADAKKAWNIEDQRGKKAGGVYAVSLGGTITGFRAGHMQEGFQGAIILDDPMKPVDALSETKRNASNQILINTLKSRKASPDTPIVVIMQRLAEEDSTGFLLAGKAGIEDWHHVVIPALIDDEYVESLPPKYQAMIRADEAIGAERDEEGRYSYWPYKEPLKDLLLLERASKYVFTGQYQQRPSPLGGGVFREEWFGEYAKLPQIIYRAVFVDTAAKTKERNDWSVFQCWGLGEDGHIYLIDQVRGKWEAWQLEEIAVAFWELHNEKEYEDHNSLRNMNVEDASSGTGLIQNIQRKGSIPILPIPGRNKDKSLRALDVQSFFEAGLVVLPPKETRPMLTKYYRKKNGSKELVRLDNDAPYIQTYKTEFSNFTLDDTHKHDDQIDPTLDAVKTMLGGGRSIYD
ncbi:MAG: hypothetical protein E6R08_06360 [Nevskiaceae bacterium]|nr:MAG: hypothetical protein E6R08_06360 [Nevskiaceae bacterium]